MDLGFHEAGFKIVQALDIDESVVDTYNANFKTHGAITVDIRDVTGASIGCKPAVVLGGFPCQGFSSAGKRNMCDPRNSLAWEMLRIVGDLLPEVVIAENVLGIRSMRHPDGDFVLDKILSDLGDMGYRARYRVLNAASFGVPQRRKRVFVLACRSIEPVFPDEVTGWVPAEPVTIGEVLGWVPGDATVGVVANDSLQHTHTRLSPSDLDVVKYVPPGGNWKDVPYEFLPGRLRRIRDDLKKYKSPSFYRRARLGDVCGTLSATMNPTHCMSLHPTEDRRYTVREAAYFQSFPGNFVFSPLVSRAYRQVGNAVPPYLALYFARMVLASTFGGDGLQ